jgi:hypothetical protein
MALIELTDLLARLLFVCIASGARFVAAYTHSLKLLQVTGIGGTRQLLSPQERLDWPCYLADQNFRLLFLYRSLRQPASRQGHLIELRLVSQHRALLQNPNHSVTENEPMSR